MKKNWFLIVIFAVLAVWYFMMNSNGGSSDKEELTTSYPFNFSELSYDSIKYYEPSKWGYEIFKQWDKYLVREIGSEEAVATESWVVLSLINWLKKMNFVSIAAKNKKNWNSFGLSEEWKSIKFDDKKLLVWKNDWYAKQFLTVPWDDKVYAVDKILDMLFSWWKDRFMEWAQQAPSGMWWLWWDSGFEWVWWMSEADIRNSLMKHLKKEAENK